MHEAILKKLSERYQEVRRELENPEVLADHRAYPKLLQEYAMLTEICQLKESREKILEELKDATSLVETEQDEELRALAKNEEESLKEKIETVERRLKILLTPKDPLAGKNIIVEIRAGTGGEEAALFTGDLFRMYSRYAERQKWQLELISLNEQNQGGFKEVIFSVKGREVYSQMCYESGTHRVQRIPVTESGGRIHTSAATVAVLPEAEERDLEIKQEELKIDVYRSSGPGGQSVNTTDSAVRITHLPTGLVVSQQDEKSQTKNRAKALRILRSRLYELEEAKRRAERSQERRSQIGTGDRSQRIRTYNFPQNRLTDHRINLTLYKLDAIMDGDLKSIVTALQLDASEKNTFSQQG